MKFDNINKKEFDFWTKLETRWIDMDSMGHVNHASYLNYMETARIDFFKYLKLSKINQNIDSSVIIGSIKISYFNQIFHPSELNIGHRVCKVGEKSFDLLCGIFLKNNLKPSCVALFNMISFNYKKNCSISVQNEIVKNNRVFIK